MGYATTRRLILAGGLAVLLLVAAILYFRRVDSVEVVAVLLFVPVFLAFLWRDLAGGAVAALLASAAYLALRLDAIDAVGGDRFAGVIATRTVGYLAFGLLGGWGVRQLARSLDKLDVYDQIDDETGLFNARFFLQQTDLETARASRYKTLFSVAVVDVPVAAFDGLRRRQRNAVLLDAGRALQRAVRSVDRVAHARSDASHRFAVICPETGPEGAQVFASRLGEQLGAFLAGRGVAVEPSALRVQAVTVPGDDEALRVLRDDFARVERGQHPEHPSTP